MKRIVILLAVLAALIGLVLWKQSSTSKTMSKARTIGAQMRELLLPDLNLASVQKIRIKDSSSEANLEVSGDKWIVKERDGYPADVDKIRRVVSEAVEQKISSNQPIGKGAWGGANVKVQPPGTGDAAGQGTLVEFQDAKGNVLESMILGASIESSGGRNSSSPFGGMSSNRFVRIPKDSEKDTIWVVNNMFTELNPKPVEWISKNIVDVQKLKQVEITAPKAEDSWGASRKDEQSAWTLLSPKAGEELDDGKAGIAGLLGNATMNDLATKDKVAADFMKDAVKAKLTTFDGFTYNVQAVKKGKDSSDEKFYLTVAVSADIPKERPPVKDEKEDEKKKKDEEFASEKKTKEEKLAKEKKAEGWTYEVSSYSVSALVKKRSEVLKEKPKPETPAVPANTDKPSVLPPAGTPLVSPPSAAAPSKPAVTPLPASSKPAENPAVAPERKPITVTTPPISVPPLPKEEIKPAPAPGSNPAKPDAPAPPPPPPGGVKK